MIIIDIIENKLIAFSVPNVCTAFQLISPLTVTSWKAFSKLKIIINYLRNSISQTRLSGLGILSIEHEKAYRLNLDQLVRFFEVKSRQGST